MSCLPSGWQPTESGQRCPSTFNINQDSQILYRWMAEKNAEGVERVMAIIGKSERMDDGVVADYHQHDYHSGKDYHSSRVIGRIGQGPCIWGEVSREVLKIEKRPGEEGKVRPDVDHLRKMDRCNMILLIPWKT